MRTGIALVFPDTSPRGAGIEGEDKDWDFGTGESVLVLAGRRRGADGCVGAGFYLNATSEAYKTHYNMCVRC